MGIGRVVAAGLALVALAGCETDPGGGIRTDTRFGPDARQPYQEAFQALPFVAGPVSVVSPHATEPRMRTWRLVPCRDGTRVCGGSAHGRAGHLTRGPEFWQITGAYSGRTFYLSPGGDGYLVEGHRELPLAWASAAE